MSASVQEPPASAVGRHGLEVLAAACMHEGAFLGLSGFNSVLVEPPKGENAKSVFWVSGLGLQRPNLVSIPMPRTQRT